MRFHWLAVALKFALLALVVKIAIVVLVLFMLPTRRSRRLLRYTRA